MKELCAQKKYNYKTIMNYIALMKEGKKDFKKPKWAIDIKKLDTIQIERIRDFILDGDCRNRKKHFVQ